MPRPAAAVARLLSLIALIVIPSAVLAAEPPPEEKVPTEAEADAICAKVAHFKPGPEATPSAQDRKTFADKSADCTGFVYDTGQGTDSDKGRRCCLVHGDCNRELAMIFANGWKVRRDLDAATYFICQAGDEMAPFEQWEMLGHVEHMRTAKTPKDLDFCEYAESGRGTAWCAGLDLDRRSFLAKRRTEDIRKALDPAARQSLAQLEKAADSFKEADAELRAADTRGGTIHNSEILGAEGKRVEIFISTLERFGRQRAAAASAESLKQADTTLNAAYKAAMALEDEACEGCGEGEKSTRALLRDAQRIWIHYRDAWTAFYRLRWKGAAPPEALDREITAALSAQRTEELRKLGEEQQ
jgi:uncharacterized protein YecT (DUF1311 family)